MRTLKLLIVALAVMLGAESVSAGETATLTKRRRGSTASILPGYWHRNFKEAKKYADDHGIPFIAVWSNGDGCPHCVKFENSCNTSYFINWQKSSGIVFWFASKDDKEYPVGCSEFHWTRDNKKTAYPFVRVWWKKGGVDWVTVGDDLDDYKNGTTGAKLIVTRLKAKLSKFKPTPVVKYYGGEFAFHDVEGDRLEAEVGLTTSVRVDLQRTNSVAKARAAVNYLVSVDGDAAPVTNTVSWAEGDTAKNVTLAVSPVAGKKTDLYLYDSEKKLVATNHVTHVAAQPNSPSNPHFPGEKESLEFGEWTMDLDQVTNLVMTARTTSHALVLFGGSQWCPDCARSDKFLFDTDEFRTWARTNNVALGVVDIPNLPNETTSPCLLTRISAATSTNYMGVTGRTRASGLSYLTRHMISDEDAKVIYDRNKALASNNTLNGGWNRPERPNQNRPGVPILVLLRPDGTIGGRLTAFASVSPTSFNENLLKRLDELLDEEDQDGEEDNDSYMTTKASVGKRSSIDSQLSFSDVTDVYRFTEETKNMRLKISLSGEVSTPITFGVWQASSKGFAAVTNVTGRLENGIDLVCTIPSTNTYLQVTVPASAKSLSAADSTPFFSVAKATSSVCPYTITTDFILQPEDVKNTVTDEDGSRSMTMAVQKGQAYRLTGLDAVASAEIFDETNGLYVAKVTGEPTVFLSSDTFVYQTWNPGTVGFEVSSDTTAESAGGYDLVLKRVGGASGTASATITLDAAASSKLSGLFEWDYEGATLVWEEGDPEEKSLRLTVLDNDYADGDQRLVFRLACGGDASAGLTTLTLLLKDNDRAVAGKLAFTAADPAFAKNMTVFAKAGRTVAFKVGRKGGSDGSLAATVSTSDGTLDTDYLSWQGRDATSRSVVCTLPETAGKVTVSLAGAEKSTKVDTAARKVSVIVKDGSVPEFVTASTVVQAYRYVPLAETRIAVDPAYLTSSTKVVKYSGSLASGLSWTYADGEVVVTGVPKKRETSTIVFQVKNGSTEGLTTALTVRVADPAVDVADGSGAAIAANGSILKTRTLTDLPVFNVTEGRLAGVMTLSIPRTGRLSAKYRTAKGTVSLAASSWQDFDDATGSLSAELAGTTAATSEYRLSVAVAADGVVSLAFVDPTVTEGALAVSAPVVEWAKTKPATDYKGYYTVSLPGVGKDSPTVATQVLSGTPLTKGDGYLTLKMNTTAALNSGKFAYAGVYPNGTSFSGSAVVTAMWDDELGKCYFGLVPVVSASSKDSVVGALAIRPGAMDKTAQDYDPATQTCGGYCYYETVRRSVYGHEDAPLVWTHTDLTEETSWSVALDVQGGIYNSGDNFVNCCNSALGTSRLTFFAQGEGLGETAYGTFTSWVTNTTGIAVSYASKTGNAIKLVNTSNKYGLTLSYTASTGVVSGKFKLPMSGGSVWVEYRGIVMPGWGSNTCNDCGLGGVEASYRPFISGTAWLEDSGSFDYTTTRGKIKDLKVRRSVPITIGVEAGK